MSEPTLTIDHQAKIEPSPIAPPAGQPVVPPVAPPSIPIDQYQPPASSSAPLQNTPPQTASSTPSQAAPQPPTAGTLPQGLDNAFPDVPKPIVEEVVFEWSAPSRPHKQRQRKYFGTIAIFVVLIGLILFFLSQFLLIGVVIAIAFLVYVLEMVPPGMVDHQITTFGIRVEKTLYYWDELGFFWFGQRYGQKMVHVEVARFPWRLTMMLGNVPEDDLKTLLSQVLVNRQPELTTFEKISQQLQKLIPLEHEEVIP